MFILSTPVPLTCASVKCNGITIYENYINVRPCYLPILIVAWRLITSGEDGVSLDISCKVTMQINRKSFSIANKSGYLPNYVGLVPWVLRTEEHQTLWLLGITLQRKK